VNASPDSPVTGGCQCGSVRFEIDATPRSIYVCHCRKCQKQSASAFGISVMVPRAALRLTQGTPRHWFAAGDSGRRYDCAFCSACGSRLWHAGEGSEEVSVKGGSLDHPLDLRAAVHIWTKRVLPGVVIPPDARQFPGEPDD
jgi:hypothetical protein